MTDAPGIAAIGCYTPVESPTPADMIERFGFEESFLLNKVGFSRWPRAAQDETVADMAVSAVRALEAREPGALEAVEFLILVTQNPDYKLPTTANLVQHRLGLSTETLCFDVNQGCSGFVVGLATAYGLIAGQGMRRGLLITSEAYSKVMDPEDRATAPLFGDGAAAALISDAGATPALAWAWGSDGSGAGSLIVPAGGGRDPRGVPIGEGALRMNGREIFNFAVRRVPDAIKSCVAKGGLTLDDVDLFVLHQASAFVVGAVARSLGVSPERCPFLLGDCANTVSSTIPMTIDRLGGPAALYGKTVVLCGFGVGLSWGAVVLRF